MDRIKHHITKDIIMTSYKRTFLAAIFTFLLATVNIYAGDYVTRGNYVFELKPWWEPPTATIVARAPGFNPTGELVIPGTVTIDGTTYIINRIGKYDLTGDDLTEPVFSNLPELTSVVISNELEHLSLNEFIGCPNIAEFKVKSGNKRFYANNGNLYENEADNASSQVTPSLFRYAPAKKATRFTLPTDVLTIREAAFADNKTLKTIVLSGMQRVDACWQLYNKTISDIDLSASEYYDRDRCKNGFLYVYFFASWSTVPLIGLQSVCPGVKLDAFTIPSEVARIYRGAFCNSSIANVNLTSGKYGPNEVIPENLFRNSDIEQISIPSSLSREISQSAFRECKKLTYVSVKQPESGEVTIMDNAFYNSTKLAKVIFVSGIRSVTIEGHAFEGCKSLSTFSLPSGATIPTMGEYAFAGCKALTSFSLLPISAFKTNGSDLYGYQFAGSGLTSVNWPSSLTKVPEGCFKDCTSLTSVNFKETTQTVCSYAFYNTGIETLNTVGIQNAWGYSFNNCAKLRKVIIPANPEKVNINAAFTFDVYGTQLIINTPLKWSAVNWETAKFSNVDVYCSVNNPDDVFLPYKVDHSLPSREEYKSNWKSVNVPAHAVRLYDEFSKQTPKEMFSYYNNPTDKTATVKSLDPLVVITGVTIEGVAATRNGNVWSAPKADIKSKNKMNVTIEYTVNGAKMQTTYTEVYSAASTDDITMPDDSMVSITLNGRTADFGTDTAWTVYTLQGGSVASGSGRLADVGNLPAGMYVIRAGGSALKTILK